MPNATRKITTQYALVHLVIREIRSLDALHNVSWVINKLFFIFNFVTLPAIPPDTSRTTEKPPSCHPSPCGPNAQCQLHNGIPSCSCLPSFIGAPPNCRPECVINSECSSKLACIQQKCKDPCPGSCGYNAKCYTLNHLPICTCEDGYTGDPFAQCTLVQQSIYISIKFYLNTYTM